MSYCRITGKAPKAKPNYFPLLPPISPSDAHRFCRITGKAFGLHAHRYIPVILTIFSNKSKCKITNSVNHPMNHHYEPNYEYGRRNHIVLTDHRYMLPVIDENNDQQKSLIDLLNSKVVQCEEHYFVYSIKEQKCNLVFPAKLEAAVRNGEIRDVMFAKTKDSVLLCMNKGKSVSLDLQDYDIDKNLFEGEGPRPDVLLARENEETLPHQNRIKRKKNGLRKIKTIDGSACTSNTDRSEYELEYEKNTQSIDLTDQSKTTKENTADVQSVLHGKIMMDNSELCESIPNQSEIFKIVQNYSKGTVIQFDDSSISSLSINIGTDEMPRNVLILGCIVNTSDGEVFVAGRSVSIENGSNIFEPGIYVQSKSGPAFIPGQIIHTEKEGERFVPGQIIDTEFGSRFVPGKVEEIDGKVQFTPAQVVHTDQGPKFIAADISYDEHGERKYSVQSFLLSPEEMTLLKPMHIWTNSYATTGDRDMDMNMFNQLSQAGIIVGSQIEMSDVDVNELYHKTINEQAIQKFAEHFGYNDSKQPAGIFECLFENIKTIIAAVQTPKKFFTAPTDSDEMNNDSEINVENYNGCDLTKVEDVNALPLIEIISKTVADCVLHHLSKNDILCEDGQQLDCNNNPLLYEIIGQSLMKYLKPYFEDLNSAARDSKECFNEIEKLLASPQTVSHIKNSVKTLTAQSMKINKISLIKAMINERSTNNDTAILDNIRQILKNESIDELFESASNLISHESSLMQQIVTEMQKQAKNLVNENTVVETLRNCVVSAVQKAVNNVINQITAISGNYSDEKLNTYLTDTLSLARALGFTDCILNLSNIINSDCGDLASQLKEDEKSYELLQRIIVMHKLSRNDETRLKSLESLRDDPYSSRSDIVLRELLRCSGICTINLVEGNKLRDSNDIPISLIYSGNQLAIEDFLMRKQSKWRGPILIVKDCFQAVVPRESSRDVLTGKCAYTVLDENGIRHFEPLHMFTALKLKNLTMFENRYASYSAQNDVHDKAGDDYDIDIDSILNMSTITTGSSDFVTYRSTILPRKTLANLYITQRLPPHQVKYRRSFYL